MSLTRTNVPGFSRPVAVRHQRFEREGARLRVHGWTDSRNLAGEDAVWIRIDLQIDGLAGLDPGRQSFRDLGGDLQRIDANDAHHRHLGLDQLAKRDQTPLDVALERRPDAGVPQFTVGELGSGVCGVHVSRHVPRALNRQVVAGLLGPQRRVGIVERLPRNELTLVEFAGAIEALTSLVELSRRALHIGRLFDRGQLAGLGRPVSRQRSRERGPLLIEVVLQFFAIELHQYLTGRDPVAQVGQNPADDPLGLRRHRDFVLRGERAADVDGPLDVLAAHGLGLHRLGRGRPAVGLRARGSPGTASECTAERDGNHEWSVDADERAH